LGPGQRIIGSVLVFVFERDGYRDRPIAVQAEKEDEHARTPDQSLSG